MPLLPPPSYRPPRHQWNRHLQTILPNVLRRVENIRYARERLELADGDFLDLDWSRTNSIRPTGKLAILTHGLLGNASRPYMLGMASAFNRVGWDVLAWNMRGLGGEPNRLERMTTHGGSDELAAVIGHALQAGTHDHITLVGFSKGGNIALKYAGEQQYGIPAAIKSVVAISAPCDVLGSVAAMGDQSLYARMFRNKFKRFALSKKDTIGKATLDKLLKHNTLMQMTEHYIAPLHGFSGAEDYCIRCSSLPHLPHIRVPSLLLNAQNDPVLSPSCSPRDIAAQSEFLFLETPRLGGHVGFGRANNQPTWAEWRTVDFVTGIL